MKKLVAYLLTAVILSAAVIISIAGTEVRDQPYIDSDLEEHSLDIDSWGSDETVRIVEEDVVREYGGNFHNDKYDAIGQIKYNDMITVFGTPLLLYPTFVDQNEAMQNAAVVMAGFIDSLAQENSLSPLSEETLDIYESAAYARMNNVSFNEADCIYFIDFIDFYRNKARNAEIQQRFSSYNNIEERMKIQSAYPFPNTKDNLDELVSAALLNDIKLLLPNYTVDIFEGIPEVKILLETLGNDEKSQSDSSRLGYTFYVNDAIDYATQYAESANIREWNYFSGGDCTNFASQIIHAGGIPMDYVQPNAWYYRSITDYARNWTVANEFANYWGVNYTTTRHRSFAAQLDKGDFIALDSGNNGSWNHWAFVTKKETTEKLWSGSCYYDYKVAQHTSDYHLWTSKQDNSWDGKARKDINTGYCIRKTFTKGVVYIS